jgi:hypothetical protein
MHPVPFSLMAARTRLVVCKRNAEAARHEADGLSGRQASPPVTDSPNWHSTF